MARRAAFLLLLPLTLISCHVVDQANQCEALAEVLEKAKPALSSPLKKNPSVESLRERAQDFASLSKTVSQVPVKNEALKTERKQLVESFDKLDKQLKRAADALERHARKEEKRKKARAKRKKEAEAQEPKGSEKEAPTAEEPKTAPRTDVEGKAAPPPSPKKSEPDAKGQPKKKAEAKKSSKSGRSRKRGKPRAAMPPSAVRGYNQARKAVEGINNTLTSTLRRIEKLCW